MQGENMATHSQTLGERRQSRIGTVMKYLDSGLTQRQFCQQEKVAYSTLQFWLKRYRESKLEAQEPNRDNFVALQVRPPLQTDPPHYTIQYPNGVVVHINGTISPESLLVLIQAS
jgi:hypothetical protein